MFNLIGVILFLSGYTYNYASSINELPLSIEYEDGIYTTRDINRNKKCGCLSKLPGHLYNAFILIVIGWRLVYAIYSSIITKSTDPIGRISFQFLIALQYVFGIAYFRKDHFYKNVSTKSAMIGLAKILMPIAVLISMCIAIAHTVLMTSGASHINIYSDLYDYGYNESHSNDSSTSISTSMNTFYAILLFVDSSYSYLTFLIGTAVFVINMIYHKRQVSEYSDILVNSFIKSNQDAESKIASIAISYSLMRDAFNETVSVLNRFFTSLSFIGIISMYYYFGAIISKDIGADEITNMILFALVELVYIVSIQTVNQSISDISDATGSTPMVGLYFSDDTHVQTHMNMNMNMHTHTHSQTKHSGLVSGLASSLRGLSSRYPTPSTYIHTEPELAGSDARSAELLELSESDPSNHASDVHDEDVDEDTDIRTDIRTDKPRHLSRRRAVLSKRYDFDDVLMISTSTKGIELRKLDTDKTNADVENPRTDQHQSQGMRYNTQPFDTQPFDTQPFDTQPFDTQPYNTQPFDTQPYAYRDMQRIVITVNGIQNMVNWIALQDMTRSTWNTFKLFGIELSDSTVLSKLFGLVMAVLLSTQIGTALNWW